jgi:hypothetical protein
MNMRGGNPKRIRVTFMKRGPVDTIVDSCVLNASNESGFLPAFTSSGNLTKWATNLFHPGIDRATDVVIEAIHTESIGVVERRPVFKGDRLYVDIRGTCATVWGDGQIAAQGANEGQGPLIIFEDGDYRPCDRLVWGPKDMPAPAVVIREPVHALPNNLNPVMYSHAELCKILAAFNTISSFIDGDDYVAHTNDSCLVNQVKYAEACAIVKTK